ncbi:MAG: cell division protein ZapA [Bacteroidales bacterium]|nr:cell division protein ZapA [Bacteroidales bacterium]
MGDKLSIKVNIAERYYPLKIDLKDEEKIRRAAKMINEKILQYKQRYTDKDVQDFLAMAALQYVIKVIDSEEGSSMDSWIDEIKSLIVELDDYLI